MSCEDHEEWHTKKPRILVTGGAGFIGSILVPFLLAEGYAVTVLDNFMHRQTSLLDCCIFQGLEIVRGDVRDYGLLVSLVKESDIIIPLAAHVGAHACDVDPQTSEAVNVGHVNNILNCYNYAPSKDNKIIIFPHTNTGYGSIDPETTFCTEDTYMNPVSLYGRQKVEAEHYVLRAPNTISLRLATVFGVSPRPRVDLLVNHVVYRAVSDGFFVLYEPNFKRNYVHVRDVARCFLFCIKNFDRMKGQAYNVGLSSANLSKLELCRLVQKYVPSFQIFTGEGKDRDQRNYVVSNEKIESVRTHGDRWDCMYSLDFGIQELIKSFHIINPWAAWGNNV